METINLKKGLFGYTQSSVEEYIKALNSELSGKTSKLVSGIVNMCIVIKYTKFPISYFWFSLAVARLYYHFLAGLSRVRHLCGWFNVAFSVFSRWQSTGVKTCYSDSVVICKYIPKYNSFHLLFCHCISRNTVQLLFFQSSKEAFHSCIARYTVPWIVCCNILTFVSHPSDVFIISKFSAFVDCT